MHCVEYATTPPTPHKTHYSDDSEMPAWKLYAKELFLYGGTSLWRSSSLKGSDPLFLIEQEDQRLNSPCSLRANSLSGNTTNP